MSTKCSINLLVSPTTVHILDSVAANAPETKGPSINDVGLGGGGGGEGSEISTNFDREGGGC